MTPFERDVVDMMPALRRFAMSLAKKKHAAEDLVQEAVLRALVSRDQFEAGTNLKAWLFTILRNQFVSQRRKSSTKNEFADPDGVFAAAVPIGEGQSWAYDLKVVRKRMLLLSPIQRKSLELIGIEQLSYEEVAERLGIPEGTVKSQVSRARSFLESGNADLDAPVEFAQLPSADQRLVALYARQGLTISQIAQKVPSVSRREIAAAVFSKRGRP